MKIRNNTDTDEYDGRPRPITIEGVRVDPGKEVEVTKLSSRMLRMVDEGVIKQVVPKKKRKKRTRKKASE